MSGPKVDVAELRRQEMMRLEAEREKRKNLSNKILKSLRQIETYMQSEIALMSQDALLKDNCEQIQALRRDCCDALQKIVEEIKKGNELTDLDELEQKALSVINNYQGNAKRHLEIVEKMAQSSEQYLKLKENRQELEKAKRKKIMRLSMSGQTQSDPETTTETELVELSKVFEEEISTFLQEEAMTGKHKNSILLILQDLNEIMKSDVSVSRKESRLRCLFDDFKKMTSMINDSMSEMKALYEEYKDECFDLNIPVMALKDFSNKDDIEDAIEMMREKAQKQLSKEYIKRQIDEVMAKHGYDMVQSNVLTEDEMNGQVLYGVNDDTAIDVFVSDESQVTMRVVGIGFDTDISEAEDEKLYREQCAFCSMHPQITAELAMRGVILHTRNHMPPNKKFNKKLQVKSKNDTHVVSRAKKALKRSEPKMMRKE